MTPPVPRLEALLSFRGVTAAALLYGAVNAALTLAAGPALALDDVKLNVLAQTLQGGYLPDNPPLFEWALYVAQLALGPSLLSFVAVKTLFLVLTAAFTYLAAKEAGGDARIAGAAALAMPLIPQFGWSFHQTLTHSTALFAATAFLWFALLRLQRRQGILDYALLGAAIGAGVLSKYSFAAAAGAALAASMLRAPLREALLSPKVAAAALTAAAVAAPHLFWATSMDLGSAALIQDRLADEGQHLARAAEGLLSVLWATVSFLGPLAAVAAIALRRDVASAVKSGRTVLSDAASISVVGLAVAVVLFGVSNFQERYAIPFLFPAYLWLLLMAGRSAGSARMIAMILIASLGVAAAFAGVRAVEVARPGKPFCEDCRQYIPYPYLEEALTDVSAQQATLVGFDDHTAGNLRRLFPAARVLSSHLPFYAPPAGDAEGSCYFIWSTDLAPPPPKSVIDQLDQDGIQRVGGLWRLRLNGDIERRTTTWSVAAIDRATAFGAALCRD